MDKKNESGSDSGDGLGEVAAGEEAKGSDAGSDAAAEAAGFEQRIRELERQLHGVQGKYADRVLGEVLREAYLAQGGRPSASATAVLAMRAGAGGSISLNHEGEPVFAEADGEPLTDDDGVRLTAESFVRGWLSDNPIFLGKDAARGSGARQSESGEISADEILRRIRRAKTAEELARLAKELGLR